MTDLSLPGLVLRGIVTARRSPPFSFMKTLARLVCTLFVATAVPVFAQEDPPAPPKNQAKKAEPLLIRPSDRTLVQRGFVPFRGLKRCYACVVGSPTGIHYAYDCETGAVLFLWQGNFVDVAEMWAGRAFNQTAVPAGNRLIEFSGRPLLAQFPDRLLEYPSAWPKHADALFSSLGYELDPDGTPVFLSNLSELHLRDRLVPTTDKRGVTRTMHFSGRLSLWENWILLAEGEHITAEGNSYRISPGDWLIEWPADSKHRPVVIDTHGTRQLRLRLLKDTFQIPVTYQLLWSSAP